MWKSTIYPRGGNPLCRQHDRLEERAIIVGLKSAAGVLCIVAGVIWVLQGFDVAFAPQSFITGSMQWALWERLPFPQGAHSCGGITGTGEQYSAWNG